MKKKVLIGLILSCFLLLVSPCINAVEYKECNDSINSKLDHFGILFKKYNILATPFFLKLLIIYIVLFFFEVIMLMRFMFFTFIDALRYALKNPLAILAFPCLFLIFILETLIELIKPVHYNCQTKEDLKKIYNGVMSTSACSSCISICYNSNRWGCIE